MNFLPFWSNRDYFRIDRSLICLLVKLKSQLCVSPQTSQMLFEGVWGWITAYFIFAAWTHSNADEPVKIIFIYFLRTQTMTLYVLDSRAPTVAARCMGRHVIHRSALCSWEVMNNKEEFIMWAANVCYGLWSDMKIMNGWFKCARSSDAWINISNSYFSANIIIMMTHKSRIFLSLVCYIYTWKLCAVFIRFFFHSIRWWWHE